MIQAPAEFGLLLTLAYLIGSIPFAVVVSRLKKIDLTKVGSGNFGATNVYRAMGIYYAILVFSLDVLKAAFVTYLSMISFESEIIHILIGFFAIIGHTFSLYLGFRGGKGVAPAAGVFAVLTPIPLAITFVITISMILLFRIVSLASLTAAVSFPILLYFFNESKLLIYFVSIVSFFIVLTHRSNIRRLIQGKENKI